MPHAQVVGAVGEVITSSAGDRDDLAERIAAGFAGLRLDGVQNLVALLENQIVEAADDPCAAGKRQVFPTGLSFPSPRYCGGNVGRFCNFNVPNKFSSCRISNFDKISLVASEL